jgi:transcriptional regulator with XRE-family HTH domain
VKKIKDEIVRELKQVMEKKKLSTGTMARLIGCDSSQIGRWIKGKARPTLVYQRLIRKGLNRAKSL